MVRQNDHFVPGIDLRVFFFRTETNIDPFTDFDVGESRDSFQGGLRDRSKQVNFVLVFSKILTSHILCTMFPKKNSGLPFYHSKSMRIFFFMKCMTWITFINVVF
jgi:hypothetical protein